MATLYPTLYVQKHQVANRNVLFSTDKNYNFYFVVPINCFGNFEFQCANRLLIVMKMKHVQKQTMNRCLDAVGDSYIYIYIYFCE